MRASALVTALALLTPAGCKVSDKPPPPEAGPAPERVRARPVAIAADELASLEVTYAADSGRFRVARGVGSVPRASRNLVRVTWPTADAGPAGDDGRVHVVDLTRPDGRGGYTTELVTPFAFEARALAYLPPGLSSPPTKDISVARVASEPAPHDRIVVYGGNDGASSRTVRYLRDRGTPFVAHNVDIDPDARRALSRLCGSLRIGANRVPVIDVRGRVLVGFDERRLAALLGDRL